MNPFDDGLRSLMAAGIASDLSLRDELPYRAVYFASTRDCVTCSFLLFFFALCT